MPANRSRTARHEPLHLRRVVPGLVAAALAVLLVPLPAVAAGYNVASLQQDLCNNNPFALPEALNEPGTTMSVTCDATLDLNGNDLTVRNIIIGSGSTFTITDTSSGAAGVLNANASTANDTAGIQTTGATLIIAGGTVNATGGESAAGIGGPNAFIGGSWDYPAGSGGTVIITGGTVTAEGTNRGAGIGSGTGGANGGTVTISGGTVVATGGINGAGIGGGDLGSTGATVEITGGTVTAEGGVMGAGIGSGADGGTGGTLTVSGGTVTAKGGGQGAAGIGGGGHYGGWGVSSGSGGTVTVRGGTVTATGGSGGQVTAGDELNFGGGAGIGGGGAFENATTSFTRPAGSGGTVLIEGGVVTATAGSVRAATIGAGGDLGDPNLAGAPGTLTLGASAVRTDDPPTATTPRTIITFGAPAATPSTPSTPVLTGGALPVLPAGEAAWNRADGTRPSLPATASGGRAVTYGTASASVTVTGAPGTTMTRGVVADPNGELVAEVCLALPVGSVIEAWVLSTPRLVAAHRVTDAPCQRFALPFAAPLDAGGPVAAGTHTLQFALATADGMEAFDIGITVGGPVPNVVPAGEGGAPGASTLALAMLLAVVLITLLAVVPVRNGARPIAGRGRSI